MRFLCRFRRLQIFAVNLREFWCNIFESNKSKKLLKQLLAFRMQLASIVQLLPMMDAVQWSLLP